MKLFREYFGKENGRYRRFYYRYLILQAPNFIQILTLITLLNVFTSNRIFIGVFSLIILLISLAYLAESYMVYILTEISTPYSFFYLDELDRVLLREKHKFYLIPTMATLFIFVEGVSFWLQYFR